MTNEAREHRCAQRVGFNVPCVSVGRARRTAKRQDRTTRGETRLQCSRASTSARSTSGTGAARGMRPLRSPAECGCAVVRLTVRTRSSFVEIRLLQTRPGYPRIRSCINSPNDARSSASSFRHGIGISRPLFPEFKVHKIGDQWCSKEHRCKSASARARPRARVIRGRVVGIATWGTQMGRLGAPCKSRAGVTVGTRPTLLVAGRRAREGAVAHCPARPRISWGTWTTMNETATSRRRT